MTEHKEPTSIDQHPDFNMVEKSLLPKAEVFVSRLTSLSKRMDDLGISTLDEGNNNNGTKITVLREKESFVAIKTSTSASKDAGTFKVEQIFSINPPTKMEPLTFSAKTKSGLEKPLLIKRNREDYGHLYDAPEHPSGHEVVEEIRIHNEIDTQTDNPYAASQIGLFILLAERTINRLENQKSVHQLFPAPESL